MNRLKLFIENFLAYGLIGVLNKIVPLLMLPIIARLLPDTADFGRFDMYNMIIIFGSSFAILGMYDAMFREFFEKDDKEYQKQVTSTAFNIVGIASILVMGLLLLLHKQSAALFLGQNEDSFLIITAAIGVWISANSAIISAPTRMKNQRSIYIVSGLLQSIAYYGLAILLIEIGFGYKSLIYANLIALLGLLLFFWYLNRSYFSFRLFDRKIAKELFKIGLPILPGFLIYWVLNSFDKIMIANALNMAEVGVYSIGLKVASISQFIYMAFAGGWQYFAFSTMKDNDQIELTSRVFEYLGIASFLMFLCVLPFSEWIFSILFTGEYLKGNIVFPYLFLSPLLLMLFQTAGNQLLVIKKTYYSIICLALGVIVNIGLNLVLIDKFGIKGAAGATLLGYIVIVLAITILTVKMGLLQVRNRFIAVCAMIGWQVFYLFMNNGQFHYWQLALILGLMVYLYRSEVGKTTNMCKKFVVQKKQ